MMTEDGAVTMEYSDEALKDPKYASYSVLRSRFDQWFSKKAQEAGALCVTGILVEELVQEDGRVVGIRSGEDIVCADVVILAEGANGLLAQKLGMKEELSPSQTAVGVKEIIRLDENTVSQRFGLENGEGAAWMFAGSPTGGNTGGGFLYTNKDSISLGIVTTISDIGRGELSVPDMVEHFKSHPAIRPLIAGGKTIEYSAHLVTEGGYRMMPELYGDGVLVAGDGAAMVINLGFTVRGMDLAIESGRLAAETVLMADKVGDYSAETLSLYRRLLEDSFILRDMEHYKNAPEFMECRELFNQYPRMLQEILRGVFAVDGEKPEKLLLKALPAVAKSGGLVSLAKVGMRAMEAF